MSRLAFVSVPATLALLASPLAAQSATNLPLKHAPRPTAAAISEADLMTRLYIFADDSMQGRQFGREGNMKGTNYIASEVKRLGLEPAGDSGTYFQNLPVVVRKFTEQSMLTVDGKALKWNTDYVATPARMPRLFTSAQVIFGGVAFDTINSITREQAAGKIVILVPPPPAQPGAGFPGGGGGGGGGGGFNAAALAARNPTTRYADAAAIVTVDLAALNMSQRAFINNPQGTIDRARPANAPPIGPTPVTLRVTPEAAAMLLGGKSTDGLAPGTLGGNVTAKLDFQETPRPMWGRNVVAIVRGSDPKLRGTYVAIGAHNDHVGFSASPVDHDSLRAVTTTALKMTIVGKDSIKALPRDVRLAMTANVDSLRKLRPARPDSIRNGADDDGSGSMALLEIAEQISKMNPKPKRSVLFVWHTGEEAGLLGSAFFTQNPTVPKDSIVAQINIDMIGRGRADDLPGGSDDFLGVVGSGFISNDLGEAVRTVNAKQPKPLALDYRFDSDVVGTLGQAYNNIYQRSDHYNYARIGIPIAFFFTGLHADYHQVTDEPQYIDYKHYARITKYLNDLAVEVANRDKRPSIDKPTP